VTTRFLHRGTATHEELRNATLVACGPECPCDAPKAGLAIGRVDEVGTVYENAASAVLDRTTGEWIVTEVDECGCRRVAVRIPAAEVDAIRYLPTESRLYGHFILEDES
jgi:hypothetical protein